MKSVLIDRRAELKADFVDAIEKHGDLVMAQEIFRKLEELINKNGYISPLEETEMEVVRRILSSMVKEVSE